MVNFITLPRDKALDIVYDDSLEYKIVDDIIDGKSRWCDLHTIVFVDNSSGKFYRGDYRTGSTENSDERPWEYQKEVNFYEVEPYDVTVTKFRVKE
jgi:hypothetical protein